MMAYNYFAGLFHSSGNNGTGLNTIYNNLGDYNTIKRGTYKKLLTAYYDKSAKTDTSKKTGKDTTKIETDTQKYATTQKYADKLGKAAEKLVDRKNADVFQKGKEDELVSATKEFVSSYNSLLENAAASKATRVSDLANRMESNTRAYSKSLEKIGIKIEDDNTLTVDSEKLKSADRAQVKKILGSSSSFVGDTMRLSAQIGAAATTAEKRSSMYDSAGAYSSNRLNSYFDSLF